MRREHGRDDKPVPQPCMPKKVNVHLTLRAGTNDLGVDVTSGTRHEIPHVVGDQKVRASRNGGFQHTPIFRVHDRLHTTGEHGMGRLASDTSGRGSLDRVPGRLGDCFGQVDPHQHFFQGVEHRMRDDRLDRSEAAVTIESASDQASSG